MSHSGLGVPDFLISQVVQFRTPRLPLLDDAEVDQVRRVQRDDALNGCALDDVAQRDGARVPLVAPRDHDAPEFRPPRARAHRLLLGQSAREEEGEGFSMSCVERYVLSNIRDAHAQMQESFVEEAKQSKGNAAPCRFTAGSASFSKTIRCGRAIGYGA